MGSFVNFSRVLQTGIRGCYNKYGIDLLSKQNPLDFQLRSYARHKKPKVIPRSLPWFNKPGKIDPEDPFGQQFFKFNKEGGAKLPQINQKPEYQTLIEDSAAKDEQLITDVSNVINKQISEDKFGRLFAIIYLSGRQFKITESDIVVVQGYWPPNPGDKIRLEKVLLVGSTDFTLIGRPLLNRELVSIDATVLEKTFSPTILHFRFRPRKQYRRLNFYRHQNTMIRINTITINGKVNQRLEVEGLDRVY